MRLLVATLRQGEVGLRSAAVCALAAVAQNMEQRSVLGQVEGLSAALVDLMHACTETLFRWGGVWGRRGGGEGRGLGQGLVLRLACVCACRCLPACLCLPACVCVHACVLL